MLNGFHLMAGGAPLMLPSTAQVLLAFLALQDGPVERRHIAGRLWSDSSDQHSNGSLRASLWRLNRTGWPLVGAVGTTLALGPAVAVDVREMSALVQRLIHGGGEAPAVRQDELGLVGDLLPGWYQDWLLIERERVRIRQMHGLELLCERLTRERRYFEAVETGLAAVRSDPLRDSARRLLIGAHLSAGNLTDALRQYDLFRSILHAELGLLPSPQMEELVAGLRSGEAPVDKAVTAR